MLLNGILLFLVCCLTCSSSACVSSDEKYAFYVAEACCGRGVWTFASSLDGWRALSFLSYRLFAVVAVCCVFIVRVRIDACTSCNPPNEHGWEF